MASKSKPTRPSTCPPSTPTERTFFQNWATLCLEAGSLAASF